MMRNEGRVREAILDFIETDLGAMCETGCEEGFLSTRA
jgi:hypothetical protein